MLIFLASSQLPDTIGRFGLTVIQPILQEAQLWVLLSDPTCRSSRLRSR